jgi:tRNA guanosine-2'-O-methyltransferase
VDLTDKPTLSGINENEWFLRSIFNFLDVNPEMIRLRKKQIKFFEEYNVDRTCSAEGVLSFPVDEGGEAMPRHLVDLIKECLQEVYRESHANEIPTWKQIEIVSNQVDVPIMKPEQKSMDVVNFQRKILPIDALNLTMNEMQRKQALNACGRTRHPLIVCASLIDKIPNLGGITRTAEIFAADRLVIPDLSATRSDNFVSLSVGAADWIEIEECNEKVCRCRVTPVQALSRMIVVACNQDLFRIALMKSREHNDDNTYLGS